VDKRNVPATSFQDKLTEVTPKSRNFYVAKGGDKTTIVTTPVKIRIKPIAWGLPLDELMFSKFFTNFLNLPVMPWDPIIVAQSTYLPDARNKVHENFLINDKSEYLVMLDSDILPPPDFLSKLLAHKKPLVGGWYHKKDSQRHPVVYNYLETKPDGVVFWNERTEPGTGLEQVDAAGAGCWLMHRSVAEAIGPRPYNMERGGEDLELCLKVKEAGFPIFIDWSIACAHAGVYFF
jgi:hypothetical protein